MFGIDSVLLGESLELVIDTQVIADHGTSPERRQRREGVRQPAVPEEPLSRSAGGVARTPLGGETES